MSDNNCPQCNSNKTQWKPSPELNKSILFCHDCEKIVKELERGILPYEGGWYRNSDGKRMFLMPPYPNVDYLS